jgi:hypothetical protein
MKGDIGRSIFAEIKTVGFAFDLEFLLRAGKRGCTFTEFPVKIVNHRESKVRIFRDTMRMLKDLRKMKKRIKKAEL